MAWIKCQKCEKESALGRFEYRCDHCGTNIRQRRVSRAEIIGIWLGFGISSFLWQLKTFSNLSVIGNFYLLFYWVFFGWLAGKNIDRAS
jgi:hypothetical protein